MNLIKLLIIIFVVGLGQLSICIADEGMFNPLTVDTPFDKVNAIQSTVALFYKQAPSGTGAIITSNGFILTNYHTVAKCIEQNNKSQGYDGQQGLMKCDGFSIKIPTISNSQIIYKEITSVFLAANAEMNMNNNKSVYSDFKDFAVIKVDGENFHSLKLRSNTLPDSLMVFSLGYPYQTFRSDENLNLLFKKNLDALTFLKAEMNNLASIAANENWNFKTQMSTDIYFNFCQLNMTNALNSKILKTFCQTVFKLYLKQPIGDFTDATLKVYILDALNLSISQFEKLNQDISILLSNHHLINYPDADGSLRLSLGITFDKTPQGYSKTPITFFSNIDGINGSSGSPILDSEGYIVGLVSRADDVVEENAYLQYSPQNQVVIAINGQTIGSYLRNWSKSYPQLKEAIVYPNLPVELLRVEEAYNIGAQIGSSLWTKIIPYQDYPSLVYDVNKNFEYLVNHSNPDLSKYESTSYIVNFKPVYKKKGALTYQVPQLRCCDVINNVPTILLGMELDKSEALILAFLHEGFHNFQQSLLLNKASIKNSFFQAQIPCLSTYPTRDFMNEISLTIEGRILNEILVNKSSDNNSLLKLLYSVEKKRKQSMDDVCNLAENWWVLSEGTAYYIESKALNYLSRNNYSSLIKSGSDPKYNYFKNKNLIQAYYDTKLDNKVVTPSGLLGIFNYNFGRALSNIFDLVYAKSNVDWKKSLFSNDSVTVPSNTDDEIEQFKANFKKNNLSAKLLELFDLSDSEVNTNFESAKKKYLSSKNVEEINNKFNIERNMDSYPFDNGWQYRIITKQLGLLPTTQSPNLLESYSNGLSTAYYAGYDEIETSSKSLHINRSRIPIIINFNGEVRFKDIGRSLSDAKFDCMISDGHVCKELSLKINGLTMEAKNVHFVHDMAKKETLLELTE